MKKHLSSLILIIVFLAGLSLLLYPTVSNWWNSSHQTQAIVDYSIKVDDINRQTYEKMLEEAFLYNKKVSSAGNRFIIDEEEKEEYNKILNIDGNGMIGYIDIPSLHISLPVYHGTSDTVLSVGVGHLEGSALPVGGEGTHCILSGHRGLPSSKLFTDIDKMVVGDCFVIRVLNETFTYEVDQIRIVLPDEIHDLDVAPGQDYCTLVTCTPYGINTHRLLIRGHRTENLQGLDDIRITSDALQIEPVIIAPIIAVPILILLFILILIKSAIDKRKKLEKEIIMNELTSSDN